jgi:hypothetical protein
MNDLSVFLLDLLPLRILTLFCLPELEVNLVVGMKSVDQLDVLMASLKDIGLILIEKLIFVIIFLLFRISNDL